MKGVKGVSGKGKKNKKNKKNGGEQERGSNSSYDVFSGFMKNVFRRKETKLIGDGDIELGDIYGGGGDAEDGDKWEKWENPLSKKK